MITHKPDFHFATLTEWSFDNSSLTGWKCHFQVKKQLNIGFFLKQIFADHFIGRSHALDDAFLQFKRSI